MANGHSHGHSRWITQYAGAKSDELPVAGYAAIVAGFAAIFGTALALGSARRSLPRSISARDILLLGVSTHKLTRILTRDWVTIPLRFAFTSYEGADGAGEVNEKARGRGIRRALGDLLSCQFCTGPWVASALTAALVLRPRAARVVASTLCMVTLSDFLHHLYAKTKQLSA